MATVSELTSKNIASAQANVQTWGDILVNVKVYGAKGDGVADDTASINQALEHINTLGGGRVRIPFSSSPYIISDELLIYSNTILEIDEGVTIKLANGANKIMMGNANKTTQSNLTITDKNIKIIGGIWDGNRPNQTLKWYGEPNTSNLIVGLFFSGVENLTFKPCKIINTVTYASLFCNVDRLYIDRLYTDVGDMNNPNNGDAIHIIGPSKNITIENSTLRSEDHAIALNADDVGHGPYGTTGDIENVHIDNIILNNYDGGQGFNILSGNNVVKNINISNIKGKAAYLAGVHTFDMGPGDYDDVHFKNCNIEKVGTVEYPFIRMYGKMGTVSFENITMRSSALSKVNIILIKTTTGTPVTQIDKLSFKNLKMNDIEIVNTAAGSDYFPLIQIQADVTINKLEVNGIYSVNNVTPIIPLDLSSCTIKDISIINMTADNAKYGGIWANLTYLDNLHYEKVRLGTKSVNNLRTDVADNTMIKKITIKDCGGVFIRENELFNDIEVVNPKTLSATPTDDGYYYVGQVIKSKDPATLGYAGWVCTVKGSPYSVAWAASTAYNVDDVVRIGNFLVKCVVAGTSGATSPTVVEGDFTDGTVTWRYMFNGIAVFKTFGAVTV